MSSIRGASPVAALAALGQRALERGTFRSALSLALSSAWATRARVARPVSLPAGAAVIGVGGPTLGGSYKTPMVLALSRALAARGERVAVAAHGYGGTIATARRVWVEDTARLVGDEALWLARELDGLGVPVVAGPRDAALGLAASLAPRVLVDALLQASPVRLALSVLALDEREPFGATRCPPAGDLRAPPRSLLEAADVVAVVRPPRAPWADAAGLPPASPLDVERLLHDAWPGRVVPRVAAVVVDTSIEAREQGTGREVSLDSLASVRVGLVLAIARPRRVERALAAYGIRSVERRYFADHATPARSWLGRFAAGGPVDVWLTTAKCATKLGPRFEGAPLVVLHHRLHVPGALVELAAAAVAARVAVPARPGRRRG